MIIRVAVGSTNPCKIEAVREAFHDMIGNQQQNDMQNDVKVLISSFDAASGVSDQPFGDTETREGARNRAQNALSAAQNQNATTADVISEPFDFAVGLEGGLEKVINPQTNENELYCMAWMTVAGRRNFACPPKNHYHDKSNANFDLFWSYSKTASFLLPPKICELVIEQNMELGHADDQVFDRVNSKHGGGTVGILTKGEIDRKDFYVHALKLCLIPWVRPELYLTNIK
ncbi:hypothetical protein HJC23_012023 [Cyclotella cryptica]|uniref:inosine/xanthosine triphosphatase n=1 Tax=Cyclotella cryptica TaxID=29204 RepID=A0ABD3NCQ0_9STRA